jgi:hypothetical protein
MLLAASLALLLLAVALIWLGLRGHLLDDHPVCRKCRFDLVGLSTPPKCPECGLDLGAPGAVRQGNRRKRPWLIASGIAILLMCTAALAGLTAGQSLDRHMPSWLLLIEAERTPPGRAGAAVGELLSRPNTADLSMEGRARVARRALALEGTADFSREWFMVLGSAAFVSALTGAEQDALANQGPALTIRRAVRQGQPLLVFFGQWGVQRFIGAMSQSLATGTQLHVVIRDKSGHAVEELDQPWSLSLDAIPRQVMYKPVSVPITIGPGEYDVEVSGPLTYTGSLTGLPEVLTLHTTEHLTVVPADQPSNELVRGDEGRRLFLECALLQGWISQHPSEAQHVTVSSWIRRDMSGGPDHSPLEEWMRGNGVEFWFRVYARPAADPTAPEQDLGLFCLTHFNSSINEFAPGVSTDGSFKPGRYRIRLAPEFTELESRWDVPPVYGEEIVTEVEIKTDKSSAGQP